MIAAFIAPEILNRNAKPNIQTDIYALGLSIYEILSDMASPWKKTFPVYNDALLIEKVKNDERPDMKEVWNLYKEEEHQIQCILKLVGKLLACISCLQI